MSSGTPSVGRLAEIAVWIAGPPALVLWGTAVPSLLNPRTFHPTEQTIAGVASIAAAVLLTWHLISLAAAHLALLPVLPVLLRRWLACSVTRLGTGQSRQVLARRGAVMSLGFGLAAGGLAPAALADPSAPPNDLAWGAVTISGERSSSGDTPPIASTPVRSPDIPASPDTTSLDTSLRRRSSPAPPGHPGEPPTIGTTEEPPSVLREAALILATRATPPPADRQSPTHVVRPGESLWTIASDLAGPQADDAEIARLWPLLHRTNQAVIGMNPGLILPGQVLAVPEELV